MHTGAVAIVDADNDSIRRYVLRRYARDPQRHEWRHQVVAAFDNRGEFERRMRVLSRELERRRAEGQPVDPREHYTGLTLEPGNQRRSQNGHLVKSAARHGVYFPDDVLERLGGLPRDMAPMRIVRRGTGPSWPSGDSCPGEAGDV